MAGNMGCKHPTDNGGYEIDDNKGQQGGNTEYKTGECQGETLYQGEFGGAQLIGEQEDWTYNYIDENTEFTKHYNAAQMFMNQKVNELQNELNGKDTTIPLYKEIDAALKKCTNNQDIAGNITNNYTALAPIFAGIENEFVKNDENVKFYSFNASYHKLAQNAYNQSMGVWHGANIPTNQEMKDDNNVFNFELEQANLTYNEMTVDKAKEIMNDSLTDVAQRTDTNTAVLKKAVELALYNESLYGLHDFAQMNDINIANSLPQRSFRTFESTILDVLNNTQTQSIDDRTM